MAEKGSTPTEDTYGPCAWCGATGVTQVVISPGKSRRKLAVVCEKHATRFEREGQMTTRLEMKQKYGQANR